MPLGIADPFALGPHGTITPLIQISSSPFDLIDVVNLSDRLLSLDITATKDEAVSRGTFTFTRGTGTDSLSPAVSVGLACGTRPALSPGLWIHVYVNVPGDGDQQLWMGRIDRVNAAAGVNKVSITCRDFGAVALNGVLRYPVAFTDTSPVLTRIQNISNEATVQGSMLDLLGHIIEPAATGWMINPLLPQDAMTVMEAARRLVQTFGGDFRVIGRYGFDNLAIVPIVRALLFPPGADAVIGPDRYTDITELTWGDEDVRNQWDGHYADPSTNLPVGPIYVEDADSIADFGPRYARIFLDRASNIDSDPEMTAFLNAALADTKDPFASHKVTMPIFPDVELDDVHSYLANGDEYDVDLHLAVVAFTHHWESTPGVMPTTTVGARGSRIGAYREYRRSVPPKAIATLMAPTTQWAPEGTIIMPTDSLAP